MKTAYVLLGLALLLSIQVSYGWKLSVNYQGNSFFDGWNFFTDNDPTHGFVNYVDAGTAKSKGYAKVSNGVAIIGTDTKNNAGGRGRDAVRLHSKQKVTQGSLVIADIQHMPSGCGTWPAFWMVGANWPNQGEIDIVEGVNGQSNNQMTLHTNGGCSMNPSSSSQFSGTWAKTQSGGASSNCDVNAPGQYANAGCGIVGPANTFGGGLNSKGGGVYATLWTASEISIYHFSRNAIPGDIKNGNPNPGAWGKPQAKFQLGGNCGAGHFGAQEIVINLTYCGDWAGSVFGQMCGGKGNCVDYVKNNPGAFNDAFWAINSVKVYR